MIQISVKSILDSIFSTCFYLLKFKPKTFAKDQLTIKSGPTNCQPLIYAVLNLEATNQIEVLMYLFEEVYPMYFSWEEIFYEIEELIDRLIFHLPPIGSTSEYIDSYHDFTNTQVNLDLAIRQLFAISQGLAIAKGFGIYNDEEINDEINNKIKECNKQMDSAKKDCTYWKKEWNESAVRKRIDSIHGFRVWLSGLVEADDDSVGSRDVSMLKNNAYPASMLKFFSEILSCLPYPASLLKNP